MALTQEQIDSLDLESMTPSQREKFNYSMNRGKAVKPSETVVWNSYLQGTYDPEGKQPNNKFKNSKRVKEIMKQARMKSEASSIHGEGLGVTQEGVGYA